MTNQEQPSSQEQHRAGWGGGGLLGVPSGFASTSLSSSCPTVLTQCHLLSLQGLCLPLPRGGGPSAALLGSCSQGCALWRCSREAGPLSLSPPGSSLVQIGKNQTAPAFTQNAPGPGPSSDKDSRGLSLLIYSGEQHEVRTGPLGNRNKLKMQVLSS